MVITPQRTSLRPLVRPDYLPAGHSRNPKTDTPDLVSQPDAIRLVTLTTQPTHALPDAQMFAPDQTILREIYDRFRGAVMAVAQRVLRNPTLAEDVVQETFVSFWNSPDGFDPARGSLKTYLLTIAHRRAVDVVRSEESRARREQIPPDPDYSRVEEDVMTKVSSETVRQALNGLDENERRAIVMAYFGGLTYVEVAKELGAPEGTVKSRIRAGMRKLAVNLQGVDL